MPEFPSDPPVPPNLRRQPAIRKPDIQESDIQQMDAGQLRAMAAGPALGEAQALAMLARRDLPPAVIEAIARNVAAMQYRKVMMAVARHPAAARHVAIPIVRRLYTFELAKITMLPDLPADVRILAENLIISRLENITLGERITLARRASGNVAGALLLDAEERVIHTALSNSHMNEEGIVKALAKPQATESLVLAVCRHSRWSPRRDIGIALLRNEKTPLAHLLRITQTLPSALLQDIVQQAPLDSRIKAYLAAEIQRRQRFALPDSDE